MSNKKGFAPVIIIVVAVAALVVVALIAYKAFNRSGSNLGTTAAASIDKIVVARGVDSKGNPVGAGTLFSANTDKQLYVVLTLRNATKKTTLAYTRYLDGTFIDSKVIHPTTDGASNVYFAFEKGVGGYPPGNYRVVSYVNGKRSVETTYTFN